MWTSAARDEQEVRERSGLRQMVRLSSFHPLSESTNSIPPPLSIAERGSEKSHEQSGATRGMHRSVSERQDIQPNYAPECPLSTLCGPLRFQPVIVGSIRVCSGAAAPGNLLGPMLIAVKTGCDQVCHYVAATIPFWFPMF